MKQKYIFLTCVIYKLWTTPIRGRTLSSSSRDIEDAEPTNAPRLNSSLTPFFSFADVPLCLGLHTGGFSVLTKNPRGLFFSADKKGGKINGQHFRRRPIKTNRQTHYSKEHGDTHRICHTTTPLSLFRRRLTLWQPTSN